VLILTDYLKLPAQWKNNGSFEGEVWTSLAGASSMKELLRLIPEIRQSDLILVHESPAKLFRLALLLWVFPYLRRPVVAVDLLLPMPRTRFQRMAARFKKILLRRVDHFINLFRDLRGYEEFYGISKSRSSFMPFKSNIFGDPRIPEIVSEEKEEFVLMTGLSVRDYDTFFEAVSRLPYPAAIPYPDFKALEENGSRFSWKLESLPENLVLLDPMGSRESWIRNLCRARVVVLSIVRNTVRPAGISVYLDAMLLGKCVIISSAPGVSDVLTDQAIIVPPEDPAALADAIRMAWENPALRHATAQRGKRYAEALGGEADLLRRILERVVNLHQNGFSFTGTAGGVLRSDLSEF
jgi:glycosyltransferase involved in cell wall biosynthesis